MGRLLDGRRALALTLGLIAVVIAAAGGAYAAGSGGTITVCVHHNGGGLYVAGRCARADKRLAWNTTGRQGPQGRQGVQGVMGPKGNTGSQGQPGPITGTAPSGLTMTGLFDIDGYETPGGLLASGISFPFELSAPPTAAVEVPYSGPNPDPTHCPGSPDSPTAAPGYLCLYDRGNSNAKAACQTYLCIGDVSSHGTTSRFGAQIWAYANTMGEVEVVGAWAVTAP
jgi:hypothetical protein